MYNKFKVKKKIISIALALAMTASSVANLPMNAFAGTVYAGKRKNAATTAPHVVYDFDIKNVIELRPGQTFNVNYYVRNIQPQGASVSYTVGSQTAFVDGKNVFDADGKVQNPGLAKAKVTVGNVSKEAYVVAADMNKILSYANDARLDAFNSLWKCNGDRLCRYDNSSWGCYHDPFSEYYYPDNIQRVVQYKYHDHYEYNLDLAYICEIDYAFNDCTHAVAYAATRANGGRKREMELKNYYGAYSAACSSYSLHMTPMLLSSYQSYVDYIVEEIVADYRKARFDEPEKKDWLNAAYAAAKAAKEITYKYRWDCGLDLEAKLKLAHMSYRIAQLDWQYNKEGDNSAEANACKVKADALQQMIDKVYADKVGDIEDQAKKAKG